jgi:hypothetical protein
VEGGREGCVLCGSSSDNPCMPHIQLPYTAALPEAVVDVCSITQPAFAHAVGVRMARVGCSTTCWVDHHAATWGDLPGAPSVSNNQWPPADYPGVMAWWFPQAHSTSGCTHTNTASVFLLCVPCLIPPFHTWVSLAAVMQALWLVSAARLDPAPAVLCAGSVA